MMHETLLNMKRISHPTFQAMESITFRTKRLLTVPYSFYEALQENVALFSCPIPMLILVGEHDDYASIEHIREFRQINEQTKLVIIPGTSYQLREKDASNTVLDLARDWFEFQQVLVTEWE
jgi:pimeloyl-ACP methyl ester carboxylesterase